MTTGTHTIGRRLMKATVAGTIVVLFTSAAAVVVLLSLNDNRWPTLHDAARAGHVGVIRALADAGAAVEAKDLERPAPRPEGIASHPAGSLEQGDARAERGVGVYRVRFVGAEEKADVHPSSAITTYVGNPHYFSDSDMTPRLICR